MEIQKINISQKLSMFTDHWNPRIIGELNGQAVKLAKLEGEFVWHKHDHEDELFLVLKGGFTMQLRDKNILMKEGDMIIIPRGVEHRPVADQEVSILLFEPLTTLNTGDAKSDLTKKDPERL